MVSSAKRTPSPVRLFTTRRQIAVGMYGHRRAERRRQVAARLARIGDDDHAGAACPGHHGGGEARGVRPRYNDGVAGLEREDVRDGRRAEEHFAGQPRQHFERARRPAA